MGCKLFAYIMFICSDFTILLAQQQSFLVQPSDVSVIQGQTAQLRCTVANKQGALQWTKDGFALGTMQFYDLSITIYFQRIANKEKVLVFRIIILILTGFSHTIPGFPTYHMVVNVPQGQYDLRITNVGIADDGEFRYCIHDFF